VKRERSEMDWNRDMERDRKREREKLVFPD
jgi:hypothetical protein